MCAECAQTNARNMSSTTNRFPPRQIYMGQVNEPSSTRNQSHQSHDHRHEQYPPGYRDKTEEVRGTLHTNSKPSISMHIQCNYWSVTVCNRFSFSSYPSFLYGFILISLPLFLLHIYISISPCPPLFKCAPTFPLCPVSSHPVCCSAAVWEQGQWWRERWKDGGRPRKEGQGICWLLARQREN